MWNIDRAAVFIDESNRIEGVVDTARESIRDRLIIGQASGHVGAFLSLMDLAVMHRPLGCEALLSVQRRIAYEELELAADWRPGEPLPEEVASAIGHWRTRELSQGRIGIAAADIPQRMSVFQQALYHFLEREWDSEVVIDFAADSHWEFERIHPFADGNGRTGRLIVNHILVRYDLPLAIFASKNAQTEYFPACAQKDGVMMRRYLRATMA